METIRLGRTVPEGTAPSLIDIGPLREMLVGWKVADVVAILGSIDIVLGEVDR
jgi:NADH-quinone oxidoreductase subunit D